MTVDSYETEVSGKWILAGEHAVLRGSPALVFPVREKCLSLQYIDGDEPLKLELGEAFGEDLRLLFWGVLERALELAKKERVEIKGRLRIRNQVPIGAGLGASAALCVALGRWFHWKGWIPDDQVYEYCRQLENLFHGESSGVDIAVALSGEALRFEREGKRQVFSPAWHPHWFLSYSGQRGVTSQCVKTVNELIEKDPELAKSIDRQMHESVLLAEKALSGPRDEGWEDLITAINQAADCFYKWGLVNDELGRQIEFLRKQGAVAVKPTGSGAGGYVLSLWKDAPPLVNDMEFIRL